mgnify:CR=1 FL=1
MLILGSLLWTTTGGGAPPPPPPVEVVTPPLPGGRPYPTIPSERERVRAFRKRLGLHDEAIEIIAKVAARQVEDLHLDSVQRTEELLRELQAERLEFDQRHLTALNEIRDELITKEIGERLREVAKLRDEEEAMVVLMIAAYLVDIND